MTTTAVTATSFSAVTSEANARRISVNPREERVTSLIAKGAHIKGDLTYSEGLKIDGVVEGTIQFGTDDGLCIVSQGASIIGDVVGPRALILGRVQGNIHVSGMVVLGPMAVVDGSITYQRIVICDGARIGGVMRYADSPDLLPGGDTAQPQASVVPLQSRG